MRRPFVLYVIPCGDYLPGGTVRVLKFLPFLDQLGIGHKVLSYFSPAVDRFDATVRARGYPRVVQFLLLAAATVARKAHMWWTRLRVLWLAPRVDIVYLTGVLPPIWFVRTLLRLNRRVVVDLDDAIFLGNQHRGRVVLSLAWRVIAGSHFIFDYAKAVNSSVTLVPSSVSIDQYDPMRSAGAAVVRSPIRIGWLGSEFTINYLRHLVEPLRQLATEGHDIELRIDGVGTRGAAIPEFPGVRVVTSTTYDDRDIPSLVEQYDIGVMPLDDGPWERAKCAMKALIYMAAGKPALCSRVGENSYVIDDGVNGCLASSETEWTEKLRALIGDPQLRFNIGLRGRKTIEERYSSEVCFALLREHVFARSAADSARGAL